VCEIFPDAAGVYCLHQPVLHHEERIFNFEVGEDLLAPAELANASRHPG
jgi:hypothetical protein